MGAQPHSSPPRIPTQAGLWESPEKLKEKSPSDSSEANSWRKQKRGEARGGHLPPLSPPWGWKRG